MEMDTPRANRASRRRNPTRVLEVLASIPEEVVITEMKDTEHVTPLEIPHTVIVFLMVSLITWLLTIIVVEILSVKG